MSDIRHSDAGHSGPSSESSSDTIEMATLEDHTLESRHHKQEDYEDDYRETEEEVDDDRALLVPRERPPGAEHLSTPDPGMWTKVLRIVIEVRNAKVMQRLTNITVHMHRQVQRCCSQLLAFSSPENCSTVYPYVPMCFFTLLTIGKLIICAHTQHWRAMSVVDELIMIIPVVLNLKGNLEMNLSARLGTAANIGELDKPSIRRQLILGNLSLLQVQATVVSFIAAVVAFALGRVMPQPSEAAEIPAAGSSNSTSPASPSMFFARSMKQGRRPRPTPVLKKDPGGLTECVVPRPCIALLMPFAQVHFDRFICHAGGIAFQCPAGLLHVHSGRLVSEVGIRPR